MADKCRSCGAEILWLKHHETKKSNPIDVSPNEQGNLVLNRDAGLYRFATTEEKELAAVNNKNLYISHFVTCPNARQHRKK